VQLDNVEKCCRAREVTYSNVTWRMSFVCCIADATNTRVEYVMLTSYCLSTAPILRYRYSACLVITEKKCVYCALRTVCLNTGCHTRYRTRHFFNNSNTNEDIANKFELEHVRCVRNEEECVCSVSVVRLISSLVLELLKKCRAW
jgi:hypothetical protein